jgi:hypothetical protein
LKNGTLFAIRRYEQLNTKTMEKNYWRWKGYHFLTLKQAKNCINGDFNQKELLEFYDKIWHIVDNQPSSYVQITNGNDGYPKYSRIHKVFVEP